MIYGFTSAIAGAVKDNAAAAKLIDLMSFMDIPPLKISIFYLLLLYAWC